jgi:hypothetical protein
MNCVDEQSASDNDAEVCMAEWVNTPRDKPISCSLLKPNAGKKEEIAHNFSCCDGSCQAYRSPSSVQG